MDEVKQTPTTKTAPHKGKKLVLAIAIVLLLAAGGITAYYLLKSDKKPSAPTTQNQQTTTTTDSKLMATQVTEIKTRLEATKKLIANSSKNSDFEKSSMYSSAAFDAARLDDPAAKGYAEQALKLIPADAANDPANKPYASFITVLTDISKGNYDSAKALISPTATPPKP